MTISSLEHALTRHIRGVLTRHISTKNLKLASFTVSLLSCLFVGAILTISIFTPYFTKKLGYSQFKINLIGSFISVGMYFPLPLLGYLADYHGPVILSLISLVTIAPGYYIVGLVYERAFSFEWMLLGFALIGGGTSSLYFTCLLTCAKIYPHFKSLSISLPTTFYGLSSFIISKCVLELPIYKIPGSEGKELDVSKIFYSLSFLFVILSFSNWISSSIVTIEKDLLFDEVTVDETTGLLPSEGQEQAQAQHIPEDHNSKFQRFLRDKSMYLLLTSLLLCVGPLESFIVNISSFSQVLQLDNASELIKFSFCSTATRIVFGLLIEVINANLWKKILIILFILVIQAIGSVATFQAYIPAAISSIFGVAYGGIFTVYPTMLANIWGVDIFGSTWGLFMLAPAFGSVIFGLIYGSQYDKYCDYRITPDNGALGEVNCLYNSYAFISGGLVVSCVLILIGWRVWWRKRDL